MYGGREGQEQPDLIVHENVCAHPESLLEEPLGDLYHVLPLRFDPYCLAWPMRRCHSRNLARAIALVCCGFWAFFLVKVCQPCTIEDTSIAMA